MSPLCAPPNQVEKECRRASIVPCEGPGGLGMYWYTSIVYQDITWKRITLSDRWYTHQDREDSIFEGSVRRNSCKMFRQLMGFQLRRQKDLIWDNGKYLTSKFFQSVCQMMWIQNYMTTKYHHQQNRQLERYSRTILSALCTYVVDHPRDLDMYTDAFM